MAENSALDDNLVAVMERNFKEVNSVRIAAQAEAAGEYQKFRLPQD